MIFGESAGAGSITAHLTMKASYGLYDRAILESGSFAYWSMQPLSTAEATYSRLLALSDCTTVACLQALPIEDIAVMQRTMTTADPTDPTALVSFAPTADFVEISTHPWIALTNNDVNQVPILHGTNTDEGSSFFHLKADCDKEDLMQ